jgi:hypothetical protein
LPRRLGEAFIAVMKRSIFEFVSTGVRPSNALKAFLLEDDYSFGILQSSSSKSATSIHYFQLDSRSSYRLAARAEHEQPQLNAKGITMKMTDRMIMTGMFALLGVMAEKLTGKRVVVKFTDEDGNFIGICPAMNSSISFEGDSPWVEALRPSAEIPTDLNAPSPSLP